jgi:hypothetical protein
LIPSQSSIFAAVIELVRHARKLTIAARDVCKITQGFTAKADVALMDVVVVERKEAFIKQSVSG